AWNPAARISDSTHTASDTIRAVQRMSLTSSFGRKASTKAPTSGPKTTALRIGKPERSIRWFPYAAQRFACAAAREADGSQDVRWAPSDACSSAHDHEEADGHHDQARGDAERVVL